MVLQQRVALELFVHANNAPTAPVLEPGWDSAGAATCLLCKLLQRRSKGSSPVSWMCLQSTLLWTGAQCSKSNNLVLAEINQGRDWCCRLSMTH